MEEQGRGRVNGAAVGPLEPRPADPAHAPDGAEFTYVDARLRGSAL